MKVAAVFFGAALASFMIAGNAHAGSLTNGSFENTDSTFVGDGNGVDEVYVGQTTIPGWTVFSDDISWMGPANDFGLSASNGSYFLDLTGYHNDVVDGGIEQTISTQAGATYEITFDLGSSSTYGIQDGLLLSAGSTSQSFVSTNDGTQTDLWQSMSMSFTAGGSTTLLSFLGNSGTNYIGLDNVVVTQTSVATTPLPGTFPMLATGLGALGLLGWHKKRKNAAVSAAA